MVGPCVSTGFGPPSSPEQPFLLPSVIACLLPNVSSTFDPEAAVFLISFIFVIVFFFYNKKKRGVATLRGFGFF